MAIKTAVAIFTGAEDSVSVAFAGITSNPPTVIPGLAVVTDGEETPEVWIAGAPTNAGCTVATSARFTGAVNLIVMD